MEENNKNYKQMQDDFLGEIYKEAVEKNSTDAIKQLKEIVPENIINQKKQVKKVVEEYAPVDDFEEDEEELYEESVYECSYDKIPLASKGLIYGKSFKQSNIAVAHLTGDDENIISNPNVYQNNSDDNQLFDVLLRRKILDKNINPSLLCQGDRDLIITWLRATSYGDYPVSVVDPDTGVRFDTTVDLGQLKPKEFKLKPNENGYFDFVLPQSKDQIEFRFLVYKDELDYNKFLQKTNNNLRKHSLVSSKETLSELIDLDKTIDKNLKVKLENALKTINDYVENVEGDDNYLTSKGITYRLEKSIISINGERNRKYIHDYVINMRAGDSLGLRKYISENIPAMDFKITVKKPAELSLGGDSEFSTFLTIDETVFLNY